MPSILADARPQHEPPLHLTIEFAALTGSAARLRAPAVDDPDPRWWTLTVDPDADPETQCWAAADAMRQILTGQALYGRRPRHLRAVR